MSKSSENQLKYLTIKLESKNLETPVFQIKRNSFKTLEEFYAQVIPQVSKEVVFNEAQEVVENESSYLLERKSKKLKGFVKLTTKNDFENMLKSLEVKDKVKLRLIQIEKSSEFLVHSIEEKLDKIALTLEDLKLSRAKRHPSGQPTCGKHKVKSKKLVYINFDSEGKHESVFCDSCNSSIVGNRYKCLDCADFDLCEICYKKKVYTVDHVKAHNVVLISPANENTNTYGSQKERDQPKFKENVLLSANPNLTRYFCDQCDSQVDGNRYHCLDCDDFDLCEKCFYSKKHHATHQSSHQMVLIMDLVSPALPQQNSDPISVQDGIVQGHDSLIDISFDDAEHRSEVVSLIKSFNNLEKIQELKAVWASYNDAYEPSSTLSSSSASLGAENINLASVIFAVSQTEAPRLSFKITNDSKTTLPSDLSLHFIVQNRSLKFTTGLGSKSIAPSESKHGTQFLEKSLVEELSGDGIGFPLSVQLRTRSGTVLASGETIYEHTHIFNTVSLLREFTGEDSFPVGSEELNTPEFGDSEFVTLLEADTEIEINDQDIANDFDDYDILSNDDEYE